mmetsp:Transcript_52190/g.62825  ORF Transcript_52190/g.62825 Transcript_52190/m.62825 type:complete len:211 (+) Transcript_52190:1613-2245(+)
MRKMVNLDLLFLLDVALMKLLFLMSRMDFVDSVFAFWIRRLASLIRACCPSLIRRYHNWNKSTYRGGGIRIELSHWEMISLRVCTVTMPPSPAFKLSWVGLDPLMATVTLLLVEVIVVFATGISTRLPDVIPSQDCTVTNPGPLMNELIVVTTLPMIVPPPPLLLLIPPCHLGQDNNSNYPHDCFSVGKLLYLDLGRWRVLRSQVSCIVG